MVYVWSAVNSTLVNPPSSHLSVATMENHNNTNDTVLNSDSDTDPRDISITIPDSDTTPRWTDSNFPSAIEATSEQLWNGLSSLYTRNESLKEDASALDTPASRRGTSGKATRTVEKLDGLLDTFLSGANKVLEELSYIGSSHPVLAVVIFAFHEVVKLDLARRDNNKKVLVVVLQMQNMLGPIFQLRNLSHEHMPPIERQVHQDMLKRLVEGVAQDIKLCRSDISHFMDRKFVYKLVLAKGYEKRFATHIKTFAQRRSELQTVISEYVAIGVSAANITLDAMKETVDKADNKLEQIISLLRSADNARERDVSIFLELNGGPEKCVNDLDLLPILIAKAGGSTKMGKSFVPDQDELEDLRTELNKALGENLDEVLGKHFDRFEKVLQVQSNNMKRMSEQLEDQGILMQTHTMKLGKILDTVASFTTKSVKLKDPEIQRVWTRMNLTSSVVKAKVFVLTFRDHVRIDNSTATTPVLKSMPLAQVGSDPNTLQVQDTTYGTGPHPNMPKLAVPSGRDSDDWVLEYIDVAYVRPIVEAMDEDGSGFISVQEANRFALQAARPKGMSLLHWIAYWAAGWHINIVKYQTEIYSVLLQMHDVLPDIHIANRVYVDDYLDALVLTRVDALLRSIRPLPETKHSELIDVANAVASHQLDRLQTNLTDMGHVVESRLDTTTIAEGARVETWILPMILLLLRRHLSVIKLAKTVVLDPSEFAAHTKSLQSIFSAFDERMETLEAKFRQLHRDIDAQFKSFAYGMFYVAFKKTEFNTFDHTLMSVKLDEYKYSTDDNKPNLDISILSKPVGKTLELDDPIIPLPAPDDHVPHPMEGLWLGWFDPWEGDQPYLRPYHCKIHPIVDGNLKGEVEGFMGRLNMIGTVETRPLNESSNINLDVQFELVYRDNSRDVSCQGYYNGEKEIIEGTYTFFYDDSECQCDSEGAVVAEPKKGLSPATGDTNENRANSVADAVVDLGTNKPEEVHDEVSFAQRSQGAGNDQDSTTMTTFETNAVGGVNKDDIIATAAAERKGDSRFYLTRTPVHLFSFRYLLDGPGTPPCWKIWPLARKRWAFAIEAVLFETRSRMGSRKAFNKCLAARRKWLRLAIQWEASTEKNSQRRKYKPLTDKEWDVYDALITSVPPINAHIYEQIAGYMSEREAHIVPVGRARCDVCGWSISFARLQCIVCKDSDLTRGNYIDICCNCIDKPLPLSNHGTFALSHKQSHSLLRSPHRIHLYEFTNILPLARLMSEQSKTMFRELEKSRKVTSKLAVRRAVKGKGAKKFNPDGNLTHLRAHDGPAPILCACCDQPVLLPCWVCIVCSPLAFFCSHCERTNAPLIRAENHSRLLHQILRIYDSVEVKSYGPGQASDVGRQLEEINSNISLLQEKINKQLEGRQAKREVKDMANAREKVLGQKTADLTPSEVGTTDDLESVLSDPSDEEDSPVEPNPAIGLTKSSAGKIQSELGRRLNTLEVKVEDIGAKMNTLLTLVQSLVASSQSTTDGST